MKVAGLARPKVHQPEKATGEAGMWREQEPIGSMD